MSGNEQRWNQSGFFMTDTGTSLSQSNQIGRSPVTVPSLVMSAREREFLLKSILKIQYILLLVTGTTYRKDYTPNSYWRSFGKASGFR
jgi:hypothetical protein